MTIFRLLAATSVLLSAVALAGAARAESDDDQTQLLRLATCQDSWLEWRNDEARIRRVAAMVHGGFEAQPRSPAYTPKRATTLLSHGVAELYPQSVGMAVGFSVALNAPFERVKADVERALGKPLANCDVSDGMKVCELKLAAKKTVMLMGNDKPGSVRTLMGCYYFYQQ